MNCLIKNVSVKLFLMITFCLFYGCSSLEKQTTHEVWVEIRTDDKVGSGSESNPFNGRGADGLNKLFEKLAKDYGENLTVNFASGTYFGQRVVNKIHNNWHIKGAGVGKTIFKTFPNPDSYKLFGFNCWNIKNCSFSDFTIDFNLDEMRKANRVFVWNSWQGPVLRYYHSENLKEWEKGKNYFNRKSRRPVKNICLYSGIEYIAVKKNNGAFLPPPQDKNWTIVNHMDCDKYPLWEPETTYSVNTPVKYDGKGYISLNLHRASRPGEENTDWEMVDVNRFDPRLHTRGIFCGGKNIRVERVRGTNINGSSLFDFEGCVFGLCGDNGLIKDCVIDNVRGDYATQIAIADGSGSRVTGCKVYGNGQNFAYGGWGTFDGLFDNNYCENVKQGVNFDSLTNRNITFRNNEFRKCSKVGILVGVSGEDAHAGRTLMYKGRKIDIGVNSMKNVIIEDNLIEMIDGAPFGAAQLQAYGLLSGIVRNNRLSKTPGKNIARGVGVWRGSNVIIENNILDKGMYISIEQAKNITTKNNKYPNGEDALLKRPSMPPRARVDINAKFELIPGKTSSGSSLRHRTWGSDEGRENCIFGQSQITAGHWTPFEINFIPTRDGLVNLRLMGEHWNDAKDAWVCFDNLQVTGAELKNSDFEDLKNGNPAFWSWGGSGGKVIKNRDVAQSGENCIQVWLKATCAQNIKVKKDQLVTIKMFVKQGDDSSF